MNVAPAKSPTMPYAEVIGDPIAQSKSPTIHRFWLDHSAIEADYRAERVEAAQLADYISSRREDEAWRGCNVTMPHKQAVIPLLDRLDPIAEAIGAVNTVVRKDDGSLHGYNTDAAGFLEPLAPLLGQTHLFRMARVFGTGGAARAVVSALARKNFTIVLAGRDPQKARELLNDLAPDGEHHAVALDHFAGPTDFAFDDREGCCDLLVNTTPLGMRGNNPLAFDFSHAPPGSVAYDIVTDPVRTDFLDRAEAAGFDTVDGLSMLIGQAAAAFALFFGAEAPRQFDEQLRERLAA